MNTVNTTAVFTNAVEAINRGHDGNYQQANQWLSEFKYDPNAWGTLVELISTSSHGDVLFHAANIANSKAKNEWSQISDHLRRSLLHAVRDKLATPAAATMPHFVAERLSLLQATMTCLSGAHDTEQLLQHCINHLQQEGASHAMALRTTRTIAEQVPDMDPGARSRLAPVIVKLCVPLLQCLCATLQRSPAEQLGDATTTLQVWLQAIPWSSSEAPVPVKEIGDICMTAMPLLVAALATAASRPNARAALSQLVSDHQKLFPGNEIPFMLALLENFGALVATVSTGGSCSDRGRAAGLLRHITAVTLEATNACGALVQRAEFANFVCMLVEHIPHRGVSYGGDLADLLSAINCTEVDSRCRELGGELFVAAAERVLAEFRFPEGFTRWDEMDIPDGDDEIDGCTFSELRKNEVKELLENAFDLAGFGFLARMVAACAQNATWQSLELAAFALKSISKPLLNALKQAQRRGTQNTEEGRQQATQIDATLALFFSTATGSHAQLVTSNEHLLETTCQALGAYAWWLSNRRDSAFANAVALVMRGTVSGCPPHACADACKALRSLCSQPVPADVVPLQDVGVCTCLQDLCALDPDADCDKWPMDGRTWAEHTTEGALAVAEAGAKFTRRLLDFRLSPQIQRSYACALLETPLGILSAAVQNPATQNDRRCSVSLSVLSTIIKFLEDTSPSSTMHHENCVQAAIEKTWPVLQALSTSARAQSEIVATGVSEVIRTAFAAASTHRGALISPACEVLQQLFAANSRISAPLDALAQLAELSGDGSGVTEDQKGVLYRGLVGFVSAAHAATTPPNTYQPEVVASMLTVLARWAYFHPLSLIDCEVLDSALVVATGALSKRERAVVQNALSFLKLLVSSNRMIKTLAAQHAQHAAALSAALAAHADQLFCTLLVSVVDTCPADSFMSTGAVMFHLLTLPGVAEHALAAAQRELVQREAAALQGSRLSQTDCQRFTQLCMRASSFREGRFAAAVIDFASIARGKADSDCLLAYEM